MKKRDNAGLDQTVMVGVVRSSQLVSFGVEFKDRANWSCYGLDLVCKGGKKDA